LPARIAPASGSTTNYAIYFCTTLIVPPHWVSKEKK
jgi:hypothetical protein